MTAPQTPIDVLVIGAGPTGLTAAAEAARHGLSVRIIERRATRATYSKALVIHARTLEILEVLGCAQPILDAGQTFRGLHVRPSPRRPATYVDLVHRNWGDTRYPFWLSIPQYETERVLEEHLQSLGIDIEWSTELVSLSQHDDTVQATLNTPEGTTTTRARWVLGCDGGRSATRTQLSIPLQRDDVGVDFALADVHTACELTEDQGHVILSDAGLLLVVPMPEPGTWRLIAQVSDAPDTLDAAGWNRLVTERSGLQLDIQSLGWSSSFRLTSGVAERFRAGRVFILGDAAHVHSPVGGQGLNTGVQDAHNLLWKLALVESNALTLEQANALLDSYQRERRAIALDMVKNTGRATRALTASSRLKRGVIRMASRYILGSERFLDKLGRGVGMLDLLTDGHPRLPNPELPDGTRLHDHVDPHRPTLLSWSGEELLVRPDRIVAPAGALPHFSHVHAG